MADRLLEAGAHGVVITLGAEGCLVATTAGKGRVPAPRVDVIDTVGAGDAFNGALAVALGDHRTLEDAAAWAAAAAALAVTQAAPSPPSHSAKRLIDWQRQGGKVSGVRRAV